MHHTEPDPLRPADEPTPQALARIESELARCVGPVAAMLVRRAARHHATPQALVLALAPSIEGAQERKAFLRACGQSGAPRRDGTPAAKARTSAPPARRAPPPATPVAAAPALATALPTPPAAAASGGERRHRSAAQARTLSPHWRGVATRGHRDLALLPLWAAAAFAGVLLLAAWFGLNARLDARARPLFAQLAAVPAALHGSAPAAPAARPRLAGLLGVDTPAGPVEVRDEAQRSIVTLPAGALFVVGSTRLDARAQALLRRVAQALQQARAVAGGELLVIGHGDALAPSLQHPSNWHFTRARAQAVADALAAQGLAPLRAEGRAEFEPRSGAASAAPRGNDRIDIELRLPRPDEAATP
jgi:flagellar motor protein MotB